MQSRSSLLVSSIRNTPDGVLRLTLESTAKPEPFPRFDEDAGLPIYDHKLDSGETDTIPGQRTSQGLCSEASTYAAIFACWFNEAWNCDYCFPTWSDAALSGA